MQEAEYWRKSINLMKSNQKLLSNDAFHQDKDEHIWKMKTHIGKPTERSLYIDALCFY